MASGLPDLLVTARLMPRLSVTGTADQPQANGGISAMQNSLGSLLASMGMLAVVALAAQSVTDGHLEGVLIGALALAAFASFEAMQPLPIVAQNYAVNLAAARRLYELVDARL
jgi:ABC-type transport system involved in cytochrome bd biosynthesis fused ATPase/permease subunit